MAHAHTHQGLNCQACGGQHTMTAQKVSKMSQVVQLIGWIITVPSIMGILFSMFIFLSGVIGAGTTENADAAGASLFVGTGTAICFGISSLVSGLIGYLLIMKKKVWKCTQCGYHIDRD